MAQQNPSPNKMQAQETMQRPGLSLSLSQPQLLWQSSAAHRSAKTNSSGLSKQLSGQSLVDWAQFLGPPKGTRALLTAERADILIAVSKA